MKKEKINRNKRMLTGSLLILFLLFFTIFPSHVPAPSLYYYPKYISPYLSFYYFLPALYPTYYSTYIDPTLTLSPLLTAPATTLAPTAVASGLLLPLPPLPVTPVLPSAFIAPIVADFLINTGNPQVDAVLGLIALNPLLLNDPLLLDSLINTGNPDVTSALAIVSTLYAP
ncbi:MAG: hypothetical protein ACMUHX_02005 [bacterium]